jgi:hypothetical protein
VSSNWVRAFVFYYRHRCVAFRSSENLNGAFMHSFSKILYEQIVGFHGNLLKKYYKSCLKRIAGYANNYGSRNAFGSMAFYCPFYLLSKNKKPLDFYIKGLRKTFFGPY